MGRSASLTVLVLAVVCSSVVGQIPAAQEDGTVVTVPDTAKIDREQLKSLSADKLLSLWFIFVLNGPTRLTDQPWTLFVPLNDGLPGPGVDGFLKDKDRTKRLILNHLVLGTALDLEALEAGSETGLFTQGGSTITLTEDQEGKHINGIKVVGERLLVDGGVVVLLEKYLPLPVVATENAIQTVTKSDAPEVPVIAKMKKVVRPLNARPSPFMVGRRNKKSSRQLNDSEIGTSTTRFEKFKANRRKSLNGGAQTDVEVSTPIPTTEKTDVTTLGAAEEELSTTEFSALEDKTTAFETENYSSTEETTTVVTSPSTVDVLSIFPSGTPAPEPEQTNLESESPFSAFENFIKTATNGKNLITETEDETTSVTEGSASELPTTPAATEPDFATEFVPLNLLLESESATETVDETLPQATEVESMVELSNETSAVSNSSNFLNWMEREIKLRGRFSGNEFLHHLLESGVAEELKGPQQYTAIIPTDEAFYAFYPIDWGFNPFLVESFLNRTLREHLVEGDVALENIPNGESLTTLAGNTIRISHTGDDLMVEGVEVMAESEATSRFGRIYSVPKFFHVDHQTVNLLQKMHPHLERAPLLGSPWPMSQFLSHLYPRTGSFAPPQLFGSTSPNIDWDSSDRFHEYLGRSHLSHLVRSFDDESNHLEYTALIPSDLDVMEWISSQPTPSSEPADNEELGLPFIDPFLADAEQGNRLVGSHILKGRHNIADLENGTLVTNILNDTLPVTVYADGRIKIGSAELMLPGESIYNLGVMYRVRGPLVLSAVPSPTPQPLPQVETELETEGEPELIPRVVTRTEISVSRQVNNGVIEVVPVASYVGNFGRFQLLAL